MEHRSRNLILTLGVAFFIYFNFFSSFILTPLYLTSLGGTEFQAGLQNSIFFLAGILLRFYFGPLADSRGRKLPILIGAFVFATTPLLFLFSNSILSVFLIRLYQSIGLGAFFSSGTSMISDIAPEGKKGAYMGCYRIVATVGLLLGPSISLYFVDNLGYSTYFIISFFIGIIALILGAFLNPPALKTSNRSTHPVYQVKVVLQNHLLWPIYLGAGVLGLIYGTLLSFGSIYFAKATDISNPGLYFTIFALMGMLANFSAGALSDFYGRREIVIPSLLFLSSGMVILYFLPVNSNLLWLSSIITGLGYGGVVTTLFSWLIDVTDQTTRATALAFQENAIDISYASASFFLGIFISFFDYPLSFSLMGMMAFFAAIFFFFCTGQKEKETANIKS